MHNYHIKTSLRGISPIIWRRLIIPGETSLARFHNIIQTVYAWEDDYLHQFHIYGKDYGISYTGGISFADSAYKVFLDDFNFDVGDKFTYEYNFFVHYLVDIRIENIMDAFSQSSVYCKNGNGMPGASKYDEIEATLNILKAATKLNEKTTIGKLQLLFDDLNTVKFNKRHINNCLQSEVSQ